MDKASRGEGRGGGIRSGTIDDSATVTKTEAPGDGVSSSRLESKERAELDYWTGLSRELTRGCSTADERRRRLLDVCWEKTYPRYKESLYLDDDSFRGQRVLDVGCGPHGGLIGFRDCRAFGADHLIPQSRALGYPLEDHGIRYAQAKSEALPYPDGSFDTVVCVNALDHVDDLERTFHEIARVLARGGTFLAQINFHPAPTPTEPHCFTHAQILTLSAGHGLGLRRVRYQGFVEEAGEHRYFYELVKDLMALRIREHEI